MATHWLRIPSSLAIAVVGTLATGALVFACDRGTIPDPLDAGRLQKTSDAHEGDRRDGSLTPDAIGGIDGGLRAPDASVVSDAPPPIGGGLDALP